jgi:pimeloyl-ACP methyl ester carboxylesterase
VQALGALLIATVLVLLLGPFLVPVRPLEGLETAREAATSESAFVTIPFEGTDGIDIHYVSAGMPSGGEAPTFVLLHGSMFNANTWNEVRGFFAEQGRVIAYDQIPYGLSEKLVDGDWSARNPYSTEAGVDQLFALLDALGEDDVVVVGNSFGGVLAAQAALEHPDRVEALVLVDAAVYVQEEMPAWLMDLPQVQRLGPIFTRWLGRDEGFIRQTYADPDRITAERMALTQTLTRVEDWDRALWAYLRAWSAEPPAVANRVSEIQQPVLVITGDSDTVVHVEDSERLEAELPYAELVVLPDCGHVPQEECPDAFADAVGAWLSER